MVKTGWIIAAVFHTANAERELSRADGLRTHSFKYRERWGRAVKSGELFPHYLFIGGAWSELMGRVLDCRHIVGLLTGANGGSDNSSPVIINESAFESLCAREDREGYVWLNDHTVSFKKDQSVKVVAGPFAGCSGFVKGMKPKDRITVMLRMFGAQRPVDLPTGELLAA